MISKADMIKYIKDLAQLEYEMEQTYRELSQQVSDPEVKAILTKLTKEEKGHAAADQHLLDMLAESNQPACGTSNGPTGTANKTRPRES
jgi:rubrerythrin